MIFFEEFTRGGRFGTRKTDPCSTVASKAAALGLLTISINGSGIVIIEAATSPVDGVGRGFFRA